MVFLRTCLPAVICMVKRPLRPCKAGRRQDSCAQVPGAHEQLERVCVCVYRSEWFRRLWYGTVGPAAFRRLPYLKSCLDDSVA